MFYLSFSCQQTETNKQIQKFEHILGKSETKALNSLVSDFERNLSKIYPNRSTEKGYQKYLSDFRDSGTITDYYKYNFQSEITNSYFHQSGLWSEVHYEDSTRSGYQPNLEGKYMKALSGVKESDLLIKSYCKNRIEGVFIDKLDAIFNSNPNFNNYFHKRILVLEFSF